MYSRIQLNKMKFHAFHGVLEQEKKVGNTFIVDLTLMLDLEKATETDDLKDTINYATIHELIKEEMNIPSNLLEHVAGRIIKRIKKDFLLIKEIEVRVSKINPPIRGEIESATIILKENWQ